jgi:hypothetical protein
MARTPIPMTADVVHKKVRRHAAGIAFLMLKDLCVWKRRVSTMPAQAGPRTLVGGHKLTRTQAENNTTTEIQAQRFGQIQPKVDSSTFKEIARRQRAVKTQHPPKPCPTAHVSTLDADVCNANPPFFLRIVLWIAPTRPSPSFWIRLF